MQSDGSARAGAIELRHGPRRLISQYIEFAGKEGWKRGVKLAVRTDFDRLMALNKLHSDSWPPLSPIFNPEHNDLSSENAFWIEGVNAFGETVLTNAARLYDHGTRSIADDLRSKRVFYDDPNLGSAETVEVTAPSAEYMCGRVVFAGAMWVRPDYRRHGFAKIIPRLTRGYALALWNPPLFWAGIEPNLDNVGVTRAYGSWHVEDGFTVRISSWRGELKFLFLSMGQMTLIRDIAGALGHPYKDNSRLIEDPVINMSPPRLRQGSSMRS